LNAFLSLTHLVDVVASFEDLLLGKPLSNR